MLCLSPSGIVSQSDMTSYSTIDHRIGNTGLARMFHNRPGGGGQNRRTAGFPTCCVADFQIGRASNRRGVRRFGNLRYSSLGRLRYAGGRPRGRRFNAGDQGESSQIKAKFCTSPDSTDSGSPPKLRTGLCLEIIPAAYRGRQQHGDKHENYETNPKQKVEKPIKSRPFMRGGAFCNGKTNPNLTRNEVKPVSRVEAEHREKLLQK
jgi:hypothetical protein